MRASSLLFLVAALLLAGCGGAEPGETPAPTGDRYLVQLELDPADPPQQRVWTELRARVETGAGEPVAGAELHADLTMPSMPMPPNHATLEAGVPGEYAGRAMFTMEGGWQIALEIRTADQAPETHFFRYQVK